MFPRSPKSICPPLQGRSAVRAWISSVKHSVLARTMRFTYDSRDRSKSAVAGALHKRQVAARRITCIADPVRELLPPRYFSPTV